MTRFFGKTRKTRVSNRIFAIFCVFLLFSLILVYRGSAQLYEYQFVRVGDANVNVYVVCLDGVGAHGVANVSEMIEGAHHAARIPAHSSEQPEEGIIWFRSGFGPDPILTYYGVKVNVSVSVVGNWSLYRQIVEEGSNCIVVNAHGETLPVPTGYNKEGWIDKIASAMAERNMTWVHTTWYPFYYYQLQGGLEEEWGEDGLKHLMGYIGKDNVTCLTHWENHGENTETPMTGYAEPTLKVSWPGFANAMDVQLGRPLKASDFKNYTVLPIWGYPEAYLTGTVIKFAEAYNATPSFGFYVHVGTNQTFDWNGTPTPRCDYLRGYAGAAAAIWSLSLRKVAEASVLEAQQAVDKAVNESRTKGLDEALDLLQQAKSYLSGESGFHSYDSAIVLARMAEETAEQAAKPSFTEIYAPQITVGVIAVAATMITASTMVVIQKRNFKRKNGR